MTLKVIKKKSNKKLGACGSWSRPVGPTCPPSCPFMTGRILDLAGRQVGTMPEEFRCYANKGACSWPSTKAAWARNVSIDPAALGSDLAALAKTGTAARGHVGGDFCRPDGSGKLDRPYLAAVLRAFRIARDKGGAPRAWFYTHAWNVMAPHRKYLARFAQVFASVHTADERAHAAALGYRLAADLAVSVDPTCSMVSLEDGKGGPIRSALVCPEQRLGSDRITCSTCGYCFRPCKGGAAGNVAFLRH